MSHLGSFWISFRSNLYPIRKNEKKHIALDMDMNLSALTQVPIYRVNNNDNGTMNLILDSAPILTLQKQRHSKYQ